MVGLNGDTETLVIVDIDKWIKHDIALKRAVEELRVDLQDNWKIDYELAWSPDSSMLAFIVTTADSNKALVVVSREGVELQRVSLGKLELDGIITWVSCS